MTGPGLIEHRSRPARLPAALEVVLLMVLAILAAILELLYLPVRVGALAVPVGALGALVVNPALAQAAAEGTTRTAVAAAPLGAWVLTVLLLTLGGPGGDVVVLNDWRALLLLVLGVVPVALVLGRHMERAAQQRAQSGR